MYGYLCRNCGHQEAPHAGEIAMSDEEVNKKIEGYPQTFRQCRGFEYKDGELILAQDAHEGTTGVRLDEGEYPSPVRSSRDEDRDDWGGGL